MPLLHFARVFSPVQIAHEEFSEEDQKPLGYTEAGGADWQTPDTFTRRCIDRRGHYRRRCWNRCFANTADYFLGFNQFHFDLRHVDHANNVVVMEIGLHHGTILNRDFSE